MSLKLKFMLTVAGMFVFVIYIIGTCALIIWFDLEPDQQQMIAGILSERIGLQLIFVFFLLIGIGSAMNQLFKIHTFATKLHEETQLILTANPDHRITPDGPAETRQLATVINTFADRQRDLQFDVDKKIHQARADLEEEKDILAALMSELSQGVLVCNIEGQILLYNQRAKHLLSQPSEQHSLNGNGNGTGGLVGLGRSVFGIVDKSIVAHTLDTMHYNARQGNQSSIAPFVTTTKGGQLIRVSMVPICASEREITGFVLTLEDITHRVEMSSRKDGVIQSLIETTRSSLANIRAAIETILEYPDMGRDRLSLFTKIIREESIALSNQVDKTVKESAEYLETQWPLEDMYGSDLIAAIQRVFEHKLGVCVQADMTAEELWLKIDSYSIVQAMMQVMTRLRDEYRITSVDLCLKRSGRFARLDLIWDGSAIDIQTLRTWEKQILTTSGDSNPLTLKAVAERHKGEVWCQGDRPTNTAYVRLLLPITQPEIAAYRPAPLQAAVSLESRPEYYDFDLFDRPGQKPELDERRLMDLTYTVFDTETTGLNPSEGDEIIAIGAIRVVNSRLLRQETLERLVDPQRPMSRKSISIHGISPQMLQGQPTIDKVLPLFYQFADDTVLVAHNAAFDMRFLQMKEEQTGLKFIQPVLDTLLLSAVVHPSQDDHSLEAIAQRLGINIIGRHTALGDAIVTGEVFLKLIPLLAEQGIHTLREAREAAQQTYYALVEY